MALERFRAADGEHFAQIETGLDVDGYEERPGEEPMIFGSGSIVSQLTQHGVIDG